MSRVFFKETMEKLSASWQGAYCRELDDASWLLVFSQDLTASADYCPFTEQLVLFAPVITLDSQTRNANFLLRLLNANFSWDETKGACFAIEQDIVALVWRHPLKALEHVELQDALSSFSETVSNWKPRLADVEQTAEMTASSVPDNGLIC
ncbi:MULTISPECIES: type III secretion system chaperone [unclassified Pseudovibrio]|uniref:type III secretion system chaperone n=1 Tax=unclassified Pseudovibrio TaxID=2627060 RepID=UPI0007B2F54E|nr:MULTISPECIES: type III secretion system chaperone [unclassified Pseudovibrio]KZL27551.1 Tir chaperone protein (CesT) [Pseudovibrio sp. Ad37]